MRACRSPANEDIQHLEGCGQAKHMLVSSKYFIQSAERERIVMSDRNDMVAETKEFAPLVQPIRCGRSELAGVF
jgi:hypothetical protein